MVTKFIIWNDNHLTDNFRLLFSILNDNPPESIKLYCYDDDRQGQPEKWVFEIVDKGYIDRADAILQAQITTNANNIQINANNIEINRQNIQTNTTQLQDHEGRITNNTNNINVANGRIAQNTNDLNALNLRVVNNENDIAALKLIKPCLLSKVHNISNVRQTGERSYYRVHSYVTLVQNNAAVVEIEIDFYTEIGINFEVELNHILPWIDTFSTNPYVIENNPIFGHQIPREQTPRVNNHYAIVFDRDGMQTRMPVDNELGIITNDRGSVNMDEMILKCSTSQVGRNANGRIFLTMVCTY